MFPAFRMGSTGCGRKLCDIGFQWIFKWILINSSFGKYFKKVECQFLNLTQKYLTSPERPIALPSFVNIVR